MSYIIFQNPFGSISGSLRRTVGRSIDGSIGKSTDLRVSWVVTGGGSDGDEFGACFGVILCFVSDFKI